MKDADTGNSGNSENNQSETEETPRPVIITRLGIEEDKFVRTVKAGNYTPTIHEIDDLIINDQLTMRDARVLFLIKSKTINFRNTEVRLKRKDIQELLKLEKKRCSESIKKLVEAGFLIEKADKDDYYFYGLNPITFDGLICLRSVGESTYRLNRNLKPIALLEANRPQRKGGKMPTLWRQTAYAKVANCLPKTDSNIGNYSPFEMLKYILLKYIYLNGFSETRIETIGKIVGEIRSPEYLIKQLVSLIQSSPKSGRAITDELIKAHNNRADAFGKPLKTNALAYIVTCWSELRVHFQDVGHPNLDMSESAIALRKELADLIAQYPIEENKGSKVLPFRKEG